MGLFDISKQFKGTMFSLIKIIIKSGLLALKTIVS